MKPIHTLFLIISMLGLMSCSSPVRERFQQYEQSLAHADSLMQIHAADSTLAATLVADLRNEYHQIKVDSGETLVRLKPLGIGKRIFYYAVLLSLFYFIGRVMMFELDSLKDRKYRRYIVDLSLNSQRIRDNERKMQGLEAYLAEMPLTNEMRSEVKESLLNLTDRNAVLHSQNEALSVRIKEYENRPVPLDAEMLVEKDSRICQLDNQVRALTSALIDRDPVVESLRSQPKYLTDKEWRHLAQVVDRVYPNFTKQLNERFPQLTGADLQLCLLVCLDFGNAQVATFTAVSPTTVSQHKFRLKKRLMQMDETLFRDGETLDGFVLELAARG